jgi:hypothetical protein
MNCVPSSWNDVARGSKFSTRNSFNVSWYTTSRKVFFFVKGKALGYSSKGTELTLTFEEGANPEERDAASTRKLTKGCLHEEQGNATQRQQRQVRHQERPYGEKQVSEL